MLKLIYSSIVLELTKISKNKSLVEASLFSCMSIYQTCYNFYIFFADCAKINGKVIANCKKIAHLYIKCSSCKRLKVNIRKVSWLKASF